MISYWKLINNMLVYMCVHKLKHFQPHSLLCHLWCILFAICSFFIVTYLYMIITKVNEAASKNFFFFIIYNIFHNANKLFQHSHTSRTIASSQHHPRETRPLLGQPNLYENCYIGLAYVEFVSYITKVVSIYLLTQLYIVSYFIFFTSFS